MLRKALSWTLAGAFFCVWWWAAYRWPYLNTTGNQWSRVYETFTLVSLVVLLRSARASGPGLLDRLVGTARNFLPVLPWLALAVIVARLVDWAVTGVVRPVDHFAHAIVTALVAGITTALWFGAIANADD